jgi:uridylate kinase
VLQVFRDSMEAVLLDWLGMASRLLNGQRYEKNIFTSGLDAMVFSW